MHGADSERTAHSSDLHNWGRLAVALCCIQGVDWLLTGIWPLVSIGTFQAVTGPKTVNLVTGLEADHWLVNTVAVLIISVSTV
jgi:hypothetical protein